MVNEYVAMWEQLNLDLPAHEGLLAVLGKFYGDIYLSQQDRLGGMEYLDFVISEIHGLRIQELQDAKATGCKVVGTFCVFVPEELTLAANAIHVGLCAGTEIGNDMTEQMVPRNTCALIKSFVGFKLARLCPFIESCDTIIGETTCDGKKKTYEAFAAHVPLYVMEIPHTKTTDARTLWKAEILRYKTHLETITGVAIDTMRLAAAIRTVNAKRQVLQRLNRIRATVPAPISGRDVLLINQISFYDDPVRFTTKVETLCDELETRIAVGKYVAPAKTPRFLLSGCPMAVPNWKLPYVVESSGAIIVGEESCIGTRNTRDLTDETALDLNMMLDALVERYMKIDCACFTPNHERLNNVTAMAKELNVDGVIHYGLLFCQPYAHEALKIGKALRREAIPFLTIETDYGTEDIAQLKTRIEAFIELVKPI
ncbi:putative dehydratase subunit MJ0007 [Desulfovibrionales bacterium]